MPLWNPVSEYKPWSQPCYLVGEEEPVSPAFLGVEAGVEAGVGVGVPFPRVLAMISSILYSKGWPQSRFLVQQFIFLINFVVIGYKFSKKKQIPLTPEIVQ
jgi:hypothetical protein